MNKRKENDEILENEQEHLIETIKENESKEEIEKKEGLKEWVPKTKLGKEVLAGKIKEIDEILKKNLKIFEPEIVDMLIPEIEVEVINIGQAKGKFGGGKRRPWKQTQKKTAEGNVPTFACMCVVGDKKGHIGLGYGKAKETVPAKQKAIRKAKLNIFIVKRGCGSFNCTCKEPHSIPLKTEGKVGSSKIKLIPAPKGTGLVTDSECKKIFRLAGIKDIYSKSYGQTKTKTNMIKACINALKNLSKYT
ncbi:MAG: 30S ribosomal protein S5 [Candidatus Pacearchaeota archaeon]